jgi:hypothetical protein
VIHHLGLVNPEERLRHRVVPFAGHTLHKTVLP